MNNEFLDVIGLMSRTMDDVNIAREILNYYVEETPSQLKQLREAIESKDLQKINEISHGIKGSSSSVGAIKMQALAQQIQNESSNGELKKVKTLESELEEIYELTEKTITQLELNR